MAQLKEYILEDSLSHLMNVSDKLLKNTLSKALISEGFEITPEQFSILLSLWAEDGKCQYELASCQGKDRASITRLVDGMEKLNLVIRIPSEKDRRIKLVYLTNKAKEIKSSLINVATETTARATKGISQERINLAKDVIKEMIDNLNKDVE